MRARRIIPAPAFRAMRPADPGTGQGRLPSRLAATSRLPVVLGMMSAAGALGLAIAEASGRQVDFNVYRMGAAHVLGPHLYDVRLTRLNLPFTYPPFAALLFWPFTELPVHVGQLAWSLLNLVMLAALTAISIRAVRPQWSHQRTWATAALALFPALLLNPDLSTLDFGQVNFLIALLVLLDLTCVTRMRLHVSPRGVLLGVAAAIKLTPLIFILFLLATRQFRAGATALGRWAALRPTGPGWSADGVSVALAGAMPAGVVLVLRAISVFLSPHLRSLFPGRNFFPLIRPSLCAPLADKLSARLSRLPERLNAVARKILARISPTTARAPFPSGHPFPPLLPARTAHAATALPALGA